MSELGSSGSTGSGASSGHAISATEPERTEVGRQVVFQVVVAPREVDVRRLRRWTEDLVDALAPHSDSLVVRLTDADEVRRLNATYRERDRTTDVLSFPGETTPEGSHLGDVVIAVPVAERQAARAGSVVETELERLVLHAVLHCLGYDHETDQGEMEALERRLRAEWIGEERHAGE